MGVDLGVLAEALRYFLAPVLPYLAGLGGKAAQEVAKESGKAAAKKMGERIWPKVEAKEAAKEAAEDLAAAPSDPDAQAAFRLQLKKLLAADDDLAAEVTRELEEAGVFVQRQSGSGAQAHGSHQALAGERGLGVEGGIHGSQVFTGDHVQVVQGAARAADSGALRTAYLNHLFTRLRNLALSGLDPELAANSKAHVNLDAVYTALVTRSEAVSGGASEGRSGDRWEASEPQLGALDELNNTDRLVLLGEPGSGKSTFVSVVALCMAGELLGRKDANLRLMRSPLPNEDGDTQGRLQQWHHGQILPVRVVLRDFASSGILETSAKVGARHLLDFVRLELDRSGLRDFAEPLEAEIREKGGLLLLDGLDEVPEAESRRLKLRAVIQDFAGAFAECRVLVTSRTYAYENQGWDLGRAFRRTILAPFSKGQIRLFVSRWYEEVGRERGYSTDETRSKTAALKHAILFNDRLRTLAERPLLLTLMASLHAWSEGKLADKRETLYARAVDLLLAQWARRHVDQGADGEPIVIQRSITEWLKVSQDRLRRAMDQLAFEAHIKQESIDDTAGVSEGDLIAALSRVSTAEKANPVLLAEYLRDRAGLLISRGVGVYTFPHRSFQEYLAACHLTSDDFPDKLVSLGRTDPERWRECVLLAGAKIARGVPAVVWQLARELSAGDPENVEADAADHWGVLLAGQLLVESGDLDCLSAARARYVEELRQNLVVVMRAAVLPPVERVLVGRILALLGEPRLEVTTLDRMEFCFVGAGQFRMGTEAIESGSPPHDLDLEYEYWLGRYPVTVAQFLEYVEESAQVSVHTGTLVGSSNEPAGGVSWKEAQGFCEWLSRRWRERELLPRDVEVRLPSEAEWEKAARGGAKVPEVPHVRRVNEFRTSNKDIDLSLKANESPARAFPWGDDFDRAKANAGETGIGTRSAVGCFAGSASPYGCEEMSGNVREWTRSLWGRDVRVPRFTYPYDPNDGREDGRASDSMCRVLRGGSFDDTISEARSSVRLWNLPTRQSSSIGLRLVLVPSSL